MTHISENSIQEPIGRLMNHISKIFLANLHKKLNHLDLKRAYFPLLLIEAGNGKITQQELAKKLSCDKVQVVRIIDYLSKLDYVIRTLDTNDRRKYNIQITEKAKNALPDIKKTIKETTALAFEDISESKTSELYAMLRTIEMNLSSNKSEK